MDIMRYTCKHVMTQRYMFAEPNCEVAIIKNKNNDILKQCEFAIVDKKDVLPTVHNIQNNRVFVENPPENISEMYGQLHENVCDLSSISRDYHSVFFLLVS